MANATVMVVTATATAVIATAATVTAVTVVNAANATPSAVLNPALNVGESVRIAATTAATATVNAAATAANGRPAPRVRTVTTSPTTTGMHRARRVVNAAAIVRFVMS